VLESYEQPALDPAKEAELIEFVARRATENGDVIDLPVTS
jgi:trimethylamine:corrinoid methyltransferase-like protein